MRRLAFLPAVLALSLLSPPSFAEGPAAGEAFHYHWRLTRFLGAIAGMFLPREGEGLLSFVETSPGRLKSELTITSKASQAGEHFIYGSEIDSNTGFALHAWSSYLWRGEKSSKEETIEAPRVVDIASGIYLLRREPPTKPRNMEIWSDGKTYPVVVVPLGDEVRRIAGKPVATRRLSIRGVELPDRRLFKGKLDLWLAKDERATPVEILIDRRGVGVHLELTRYEPARGAGNPK